MKNQSTLVNPKKRLRPHSDPKKYILIGPQKALNDPKKQKIKKLKNKNILQNKSYQP